MVLLYLHSPINHKIAYDAVMPPICCHASILQRPCAYYSTRTLYSL